MVRRRHPPEAYAARRSPSKAIGATWRAAFAFAKETTLEPLASNVSSFAIKLTSHYVTNQIVLRIFRRPVECRDNPILKSWWSWRESNPRPQRLLKARSYDRKSIYDKLQEPTFLQFTFAVPKY